MGAMCCCANTLLRLGTWMLSKQAGCHREALAGRHSDGAVAGGGNDSFHGFTHQALADAARMRSELIRSVPRPCGPLVTGSGHWIRPTGRGIAKEKGFTRPKIDHSFSEACE